MACSSTPDSDYKAILVKNESSDATVFLFVYHPSDPLCWLSLKKESIAPGKQYLYRDSEKFKYEIRREKQGEKRTICLEAKMSTEDKLLIVDKNGEVDEKDLSEYPNEHQIAVRRKNMEDEASFELGRNFYTILRLDMKQVRKKSLEEQDAIIRKAYHKQMLLFHPDRNPDAPDGVHMCQEITMAYGILGDRKKRALYHDMTDYRGGWLSRSRWKAIFKPEAHGSKEKWKRIGLLVFSGLLIGASIAITVLTAGSGVAVIIVSNIAASALMGGAIQGAIRTVSYDSVKNGVKFKKYLTSVGIGAVFGAIAGGAGAGVNVALGAVGAAVTAAETATEELMLNALAPGAINGVLTSVSTNVDKMLIDGKKVTAKEMMLHLAFGALTGIALGVIGAGIGKIIAKKKLAGLSESEAVEETLVEWECVTDFLTSIDYKPQCGEEEAPKFTNNPFEARESDCGSITYVCNGAYYSRMLVEYSVDGPKKEEIGEGSHSVVKIPYNASNIKVRFQNMRFINTWCDVKKYDRKNRHWCEPTVPHVFNFERTVTRTFTLEGSLYYVAVMKVTDERYKELDIME